MEDPTFSDIISFICLSDSQFIWLPVNFFLYSVPTTILPQKKGHKVFLRRKKNKNKKNTSATTQKWWEQNCRHTIKSVILYLIYTRNCVDLERNRTRWLWCWINLTFCIFSGGKKKGAHIHLKYKLSLELKKEQERKKQNSQTANNWPNIFWHKLFAHHQSKWEGASRSEEGSTTPELLTVLKYCIWQQQYWQGGVRGHLRRISETGKVTKIVLE